MMPSGVPPMPSSRSMPVPSRAAMIAPATSPSTMNLIRAPVARISSASCSCRGRSSSTTATSSGLTALGLGHLVDVLGHRVADVDDVGGLGAGDQLLHVEDGRRVVHRAAGRDGEDGDGVGHPLGGQRGAVDRVDGHVALGPLAGADLLAVEQHRGVVLLALADHDRAAHADGGDQHPHRVDRDAVGAVLVALAHPPSGSHRRGLGHPDQLEREVAVGVGRCDGEGLGKVSLWTCRPAYRFAGVGRMSLVSTPRAPARGGGSYQRSASGLLGAMVATVLAVVAFVAFRAPHPRQRGHRGADGGLAHLLPGRARRQQAPGAGAARVAAVRAGRPPACRTSRVPSRPGTSACSPRQGEYVGIDESTDGLDDLVHRYVDPDASRGSDVTIAASAWQVYTDSGGDYALGRTVPARGGRTPRPSSSAARRRTRRSGRSWRPCRHRRSRGASRPPRRFAGSASIDSSSARAPSSARAADAGELLAALPQGQRLGQAGAALLEGADHLDQLVAGLLVGERHSSSSPSSVSGSRSIRSTAVVVAPIRPSATRMWRSWPGSSVATLDRARPSASESTA